MILFDASTTELATEPTTIAFEMPEGYDLTATVPRTAILTAIISLVAIIAVIIVLFAFVKKKAKITLAGILAGIGTYALFYYMAINGIVNVLFATLMKNFADNPVAVTLFAGVFCGTIPILGRMLIMKLFPTSSNYCRDTLGMGVGIMGAEGAMAAVNMFFAVITSNTINKVGLQTLLDNELAAEGATQETVERLLANARDIIDYKPSAYIYVAIICVAMMVFHIAASVPLHAAFKGVVSKAWYSITIGSFVVIQLVKFAGESGLISPIVRAIIIIVAVAAFSYFAIKMFKDNFMDEQPPEQPKKPVEQGPKKMPKFENLSNL